MWFLIIPKMRLIFLVLFFFYVKHVCILPPYNSMSSTRMVAASSKFTMFVCEWRLVQSAAGAWGTQLKAHCLIFGFRLHPKPWEEWIVIELSPSPLGIKVTQPLRTDKHTDTNKNVTWKQVCLVLCTIFSLTFLKVLQFQDCRKKFTIFLSHSAFASFINHTSSPCRRLSSWSISGSWP